MKLRLASIAFLLGALSIGLSWMTLQPVLVWLVGVVRRAAPQEIAVVASRLNRALPLDLALDLSLAAVLAFVVLYFAVGRPLMRTEAEIDRLGRLELEGPTQGSAGPILSRLQRAIARMSDALRREQALTRRQLADLTEANRHLGRTQAELIASERLATVGKLAAGVAHEIGNPLAGILGYLGLAKDRATDPEVKDYLERIDAEVQRIDGIVRGLLDLGRPARSAPTAVDLAQLLSTCADLLGAGPDFAGIQMTCEVERGTSVRAEAGPLSQVFLNLLLNAAQALQGKGRIRIRAAAEDGVVRTSVEDSGPGIPDEVMARLFEPFFTTKAERRGTGLGLAISHHLVSQMGGQLSAANAPTGGAVFTVVLPKATA